MLSNTRPSLWRMAARALGWNDSSYTLMSLFAAVIVLIVIVWWLLVEDYFALVDPRYPLWVQLDWLLLELFAFMSVLVMAGADLRYDARVALVGLAAAAFWRARLILMIQ